MQTNHSHGTQATSPHSAAAQANNYGVPAGLLWANTALSAAAFVAGLVALGLVMFRLDDYSDRLALEARLKTQAVDELRVEANVSRKLAGLPPINYQEHD